MEKIYQHVEGYFILVGFRKKLFKDSDFLSTQVNVKTSRQMSKKLVLCRTFLYSQTAFH